jgi:glucosamine-6-phosphate deaminase
MQLYMAEDSKALASMAADIIQQTIVHKPNCVLGLATGSTPIVTYQELIKRYKDGQMDFSQVKSFNLDEYYGLEPDHPQSYHAFMYEQLFQHINITAANIHIPSGTPENIEEYCKEYEQSIKDSGGIDIQLLGIGKNGHIGFNEPSKELETSTHLVRLTEGTIEANARFFATKEEVPQYAITMGIGSIFAAKKIILLAHGEEKAKIIHKLFETGITTDIPASILRLHPNVTILVDQKAGSLVKGYIKEYC